MHISDGILDPSVLVGGYLVAGAVVGLSARNLDADDMPRIAVMSAAFFVASLIHVKTGATSVHLLLHGLVGIVLGRQAMLAVAMGLTLQALLLQHGGVSTVGVNCCIMGLPALLVGFVYRLWGRGRSPSFRVVFAALLTAAAVILSALIAALALYSAGWNFQTVVGAFLIAHIPIVAIESVITGGAVSFLLKVKPEILSRHSNASPSSLSSSVSPS